MCIGFAISCLDVGTVVSQASDNPPGLLYSTLLNGVKLNQQTGSLRLEDIQAVFLPVPQSTDSWKYNATDGKLTATLTTDQGKALGEYRFHARQTRGVFWLLGSHQVTTPGGGTGNDIKITSAGNYLLQFAVEDKPFYKFPFSVAVQTSGDEFDPGKRYYLDGDWSKMGYLFYGGANPKSSIEFKTWLRDKNKTDAFRSDKVDIRVIRSSDKKVVAVSGTRSNGSTYQLKPTWVRYSFVLHTPKTVEPISAADILKNDGNYHVEVVVNGSNTARFPFSIKDNKIPKTGRQIRESTDPKIYVEGGRDAWWLEAANPEASETARASQ